MILLPQILYLFRTLPIPVKKAHMLTINKVLRKFVWKDMKPHSSHTLLLKHKNAGGMGMTDLRDYWVATRLSQLRSWFNLSPDKLWIDIEQNASPTPSLNTLLLVDVWKPWPLKNVPPINSSLSTSMENLLLPKPSTITNSHSTPTQDFRNNHSTPIPSQMGKTRCFKHITYVYQSFS